MFKIYSEKIKNIQIEDMLKNRVYIKESFEHSDNIFNDILSYINEHNIAITGGMVAPVYDAEGRLMYVAEYNENNKYIYHKHHFVSEDEHRIFPEYLEYNIDSDRVDLDLLERADIFVFGELNEYSYGIAKVILGNTEDKEIVFLDEKCGLFFEDSVRVKYIEENNIDDYVIDRAKRVMYITKEDQFSLRNNHFGYITMFHNIFWIQYCSRDVTEDIKYYILRCKKNSYPAGLGSQLKWFVALNKFVHDKRFKLYVEKSPYMLYSGKMLSKYFELGIENDYPNDMEKNSVEIETLSCVGEIYRFRKYFQFGKMEIEETLNKETIRMLDKVASEVLPDNSRVLGVNIRGCDYNSQALGHPVQAHYKQVLEIAKKMIEEGRYAYVYLVTEVQEAFEAFKEEFEDKLLYYEQKRYETERFNGEERVVIAQLISKEEEEKEMLDYLKAVYIMSKCTSMLSSGACGVTVMALELNSDKYEEVDIFDLGMYR